LQTYLNTKELTLPNVNFEKVINYAIKLNPTPVELVDANYLKRTEAEERKSS